MKFLKLTLLSLCAVSVFSCKKKEDIVTFDQDIPYVDTVDMVNLGAGGSLPVSIPIPPIPYGFPTNYQYYLSQYNTKADLVSSAKLTSFGLEVLVPANQDMSFLDTIRVKVYGNNGSLPERLVAYHYGRVPANTRKLDLTVVDEELKAYFLQDSVNASLSGYINAIPAPGTRLLVKSSFHLKAQPLN